MAELKETPVTIIVSGRNSSSTLRSCLESLAGQDYPIGEILCFDNRSTDDSREIAGEVAASSKVPIRVIDGGEGGTLSSAYNKGAQMATCDIIVLCHSDCMIPSSGELRKLITPLVSDTSASAAYPIQLMPREVWRKFPFWQKFLFASAVERVGHMRCAMFDAVWRDLYLKAGGFNEKRFTSTCGYGGEDNDAQVRFSKYGKQLFTEARVLPACANIRQAATVAAWIGGILESVLFYTAIPCGAPVLGLYSVCFWSLLLGPCRCRRRRWPSAVVFAFCQPQDVPLSRDAA